MDPLGFGSDDFHLRRPAILEGGHAPVDVQGFSTGQKRPWV